jgi:hypothetical protein
MADFRDFTKGEAQNSKRNDSFSVVDAYACSVRWISNFIVDQQSSVVRVTESSRCAILKFLI